MPTSHSNPWHLSNTLTYWLPQQELVPPVDPSLPGTGHSYLLHSLYFKSQWTLLETVSLRHATVNSGVSYRPFTLRDRGFLLKTLYFVTADNGLCLLQTLYIATQWTLESPTDPLLGVAVDTSVSTAAVDTLVSTADPIHCGIWDNDVSCRPYTLWHNGHWTLLRTLYLVSQQTHCCLLESLYIVAQGTMMSPIHCGTVNTGVSCRPSTWCHSRHIGLLESLHIVAQGTMMSPADPIHCGIVDTGVSCRPSTWCRSRHTGVSWKAYTLWHRGQLCLLQTLHTVAWATIMSPADPIHCGIVDNWVSCRPSASRHITSICIHAAAKYLLVTSVKKECLVLFLVTATLTSIFDNSQQCHNHLEMVV